MVHVSRTRTRNVLLTVAAFGVLGAVLLSMSHAATSVVNKEAESGTLSTNAKNTSSTGASGSAAVKFTASASNFPQNRNLYTWPFSWDSIWNLPISNSAQFEVVHLDVDPAQNGNQGIFLDLEDISVDTALPTRTLQAGNQQVQVHADTSLAGNSDVAGNWNNCSTFLGTDNLTIYQGQPLNYPASGNPSYQYTWPAISLKSTGTAGCHGGSSLSGLGGDIRKGEMTSTSPLYHALKINLDCIIYCSRSGNGGKGYTWPATVADGGYNNPSDYNYYDRFGNADPYVLQGALLALPPTFNVSSLTSAHAKKIAQALKDYGGYVVDNTAWSGYNPSATKGVNAFNIQRGAQAEFPDSGCPLNGQGGCQFYVDVRTIFSNLVVVKNNTAATPGGGAIGTVRHTNYAPVFTDGTGAPPAQP